MSDGDPASRADRSVSEPGISGEEVTLGSAQQVGPAGVTDGDAPAAGTRRPGVVDWLLVAFVTLVSALAALVGVAYLPWHIGAVPMPVSALLGVGAMILAPRAAYRLTGSMLAAVLPVVAWFGTTVWLVLHRNPMMLSQALSVVNGQWRVMVLLGLGSLAAAATLTLVWAERSQARYASAAAAGSIEQPPMARPDRVGAAPVAAERAEPDEPPARPT